MKSRWVAFLLPIGLGLAGIMLLVRVTIVDSAISLPTDFDLIVILFGLSLSIFASINLLIREGMERLRQQSIEQARQLTLDEHRRFLQRLDHELKNPLTTFRAGIGSLMMTLGDNDQRRILAAMGFEVDRLSRLVTDLRKLNELETLPLEAYAIEMNALFEEVSALAQELPGMQDRQFTLELPQSMPDLIGDQDLLLLAIYNLLDNALKFTQPDDRINLRAFIDEENFVVEVIDSGIGIPDAEIPLVWEELHRASNASHIPGSGVGLALVEAIVERHGGEVSLHSEVGKGTTVTLRLPLD